MNLLPKSMVQSVSVAGGTSFGTDPFPAPGQPIPVDGSCSGTSSKLRSDFRGDAAHPSPNQPYPPVCLDTFDCLFSNGGSASPGTVVGSEWLCDHEPVDGREQGVWYRCESSRSAVRETRLGKECRPLANEYGWTDWCPGTEIKWQSDTRSQEPYPSPEQPPPPQCLTAPSCLFSTGRTASRGTVVADVWICSPYWIWGKQQGVWVRCEETRALAGEIREGRRCVATANGFRWALD